MRHAATSAGRRSWPFSARSRSTHGVTILDHCPALELLTSDGVAAGARGVNKQDGQDLAGARRRRRDGHRRHRPSSPASSAIRPTPATVTCSLPSSTPSSPAWSSPANTTPLPAETYLSRGAYRSGAGTYYRQRRQPNQGGSSDGRRDPRVPAAPGISSTAPRTTKERELIAKTHAAAFQYFQRKGIDPFTRAVPDLVHPRGVDPRRRRDRDRRRPRHDRPRPVCRRRCRLKGEADRRGPSRRRPRFGLGIRDGLHRGRVRGHLRPGLRHPRRHT